MAKVSNAAFMKMTPAKKRVQVALDVLAQIEARKIVPMRGVYLQKASKKNNSLMSAAALKRVVDGKGDVELRDVLRKIPKCEACALGSMFMVAVERADKLKIGQMCDLAYVSDPVYPSKPTCVSGDRGDTTDYLGKWFSQDQLDTIESYFESNYDVPAAERMASIMRNIVKNRGRFVRP